MTLSVLPQDTPLTGDNAIAWAEAILQACDAPRNDATVGSMLAWFNREGGGGENNPMNTTLDTPDATGSINSDGVKNYRTPDAGVAATVLTLRSGYPAIVNELRTGRGLDQKNATVEAELSKWSGGGYDSLSPVKVNIVQPAAGTFKATLSVDPDGKWTIEGAPSRTARLGTSREWHARISLDRRTGKWTVKGTAL